MATAVNEINGADTDSLYQQLLKVAQRKTVEADTKLDKHGKKVEDSDYGDNVLIVKGDGVEAGENGVGQGQLF